MRFKLASVIILAASIAGCSHSSGLGSSALPNVTRPAAQSAPLFAGEPVSPIPSYSILYNFQAGGGGYSTLTPFNGLLYGVSTGGSYGYVFNMTPSGTVTTVYTFNGQPTDASASGSDSSLTRYDGVFYGTTSGGGANNDGAIYRLTPAGTEKVLHSFNVTDGANPGGAPVIVNGVLYGTTSNGGAYGHGVLYRIGRFGFGFKVLHNFGSGTDGQTPVGNLVVVNGVIYGTTTSGGAYDNGAVYEVPAGESTEVVLYSFNYGNDAQEPRAGLLYYGGGAFFGTTVAGGANNSGAVFRVTTAGAEKVIYSFGSQSNDGAQPLSPLVAYNHMLYGTTQYGGANPPYGTIFSITPTGTEKVVHSFGSGSDGIWPASGLTAYNGVLYGETNIGGQYGDGLVYGLKP